MTDNSASASRTTQLRRYVLVAGTTEDFLAWWNDVLVPVRIAAGFTVDYASYEAESREFVWAVSASGSRADFLALEKTYMESEARAAAFDGVPQRVESMHLALVDRLA